MQRQATASIPFRKMHGLGNDFVVVDRKDLPRDGLDRLARAVADRRRGVGFDQMVILDRGEAVGSTVVNVTFLNADGSPSGACGNGARCAARLVMEETGVHAVVIETEGGTLHAWREETGSVTVDMGRPRINWRAIPLARPADVDALPLPGAPSAVSMGNPHCVFFVDALAEVDMAARGQAVEADPLFPERANVSFVEIAARDAVRAAVWERGAGATLACGSAACAIVVAGVRRGLLDRRVAVALPGGTLTIDWPDDHAGVRMTGPTAEVARGALTAEFLAGAA